MLILWPDKVPKFFLSILYQFSQFFEIFFANLKNL